MKITAVRHGETIGNVEHIVQSRTGGQLTERGIAQANEVGVQLADQQFVVAYVSDLTRCQQTADCILQSRAPIERITTAALRERDQGPTYEGGHWEDLPWWQFEGDNLATPIPGGESWLQVEARVADFLNEIYMRHADGHVLLVTHGGVIKTLRSLLTDMDLQTSVDEMIPNGTLAVWTMTGKVAATVQ